MQVIRLIILLTTFTHFAFAQVRLSGFVKEEGTGELIPFANISIDSTRIGTSCNAYGFFSLLLPERSVILRVSSIGFATRRLHLSPQKDSILQIILSHSTNVLQELTVYGGDQGVLDQEPETRLAPFTIRNTPVLLGEKDVLKTIQLLPGVQFGTEGSNELYVRGGTPDQNLIILDDAPVYNANHLFGFISVFNTDAITNASFWKSGFPAQYGGRVSSITDLKMKEGNKERIAGEGGIGILSSRLTVEGPLVSKRSSFIISGRRSFLDLFITPFLSDQQTKYRLYDINGKINFELDRNNTFYASIYTGSDKMLLSESEIGSSSKTSSTTHLGWGNMTATFRWSHVVNQQVFANTTLLSSRFKFYLSDEFERSGPSAQYQISNYESGVSDLAIKTDFDYFINDRHTIKAGYVYTHHQYNPKAFEYQDRNLEIKEKRNETHKNHEIGLYLEDQWVPMTNFDFRLGGRYNLLVTSQKTYAMFEPRVQVSYSFEKNSSIMASYMRANQFVHLLSTTGMGLATDLWVPVTDRVPPIQSDQVSLRFLKRLPNKNLKVSFETYRKYLRNIINYTDDASFLIIAEAPKDISWEDNITKGKGTSYGSEVFVEKTGKLSGWIAYTLSWNVHRFGELNNGNPFFARYDSRHAVSTNVGYRLSGKVNFALTWTYRSGAALNAPQGYYFTNTTNFSQDIMNTNMVPYYGSRNSFRTAGYHRLDIAAQFHRKRKSYERFWEIGLFNAYNRKNPFYYYLKTNNTGGGQRIELKKRALFPIIPSISYNIKF